MRLGLTSGIPADTVLSEGQRHPSYRVERDTGSNRVDSGQSCRRGVPPTLDANLKSWAHPLLFLHPPHVCVVKNKTTLAFWASPVAVLSGFLKHTCDP